MRVCVGDKNGGKTPARSRGRGIPQTGGSLPVEDMPRKPLDRISRFFPAHSQPMSKPPLVYAGCAKTGPEFPALALGFKVLLYPCRFYCCATPFAHWIFAWRKPQGIICSRRPPVGGPWRSWPTDRRGVGLRSGPSAPAVGQHGGMLSGGGLCN